MQYEGPPEDFQDNESEKDSKKKTKKTERVAIDENGLRDLDLINITEVKQRSHFP